MAQQLKRWESPRHRGRNDKGRGGSARLRQQLKQRQLWRKRLKKSTSSDEIPKKREASFSLFLCIFSVIAKRVFQHNKDTRVIVCELIEFYSSSLNSYREFKQLVLRLGIL
ncbi:hypothetical protein [Almyronema epifaneia]|uniref:Transposase n=1 Tax=Almyronema epifaneia S1 TaxID=2991925 RepID=A0ABW6IDJ2_9CYAN